MRANYPSYIPKQLLSSVFAKVLAVFLLVIGPVLLNAQEPKIRAYDVDEGLSHRNVFKIQQDADGYIWIATLNGLNRFDGYQFQAYNSNNRKYRIPQDVIADMLIDAQNNIWLASPDYLVQFQAEENTFQTRQLTAKQVRREALIPYSLFEDSEGKIWSATFDEKLGNTHIQYFWQDSIHQLFQVPGKYPQRSMVQMDDRIFLNADEKELWVASLNGEVQQRYQIPYDALKIDPARIVAAQVFNDEIWMLNLQGKIIRFAPATQEFKGHSINRAPSVDAPFSAFLVTSDESIWLGGRDLICHYNKGKWKYYNESIKALIKNTPTCRQIFQDQSGVIWLATDFGIIQLIASDNPFVHYLSGGSEYCSNVYCSTRGITEDDKGNIYISYYNSIHVLEPDSDAPRLLFPANNYFNYPFGITYFDNALFTGNGLRIDLESLQLEKIFDKPSLDMGAVIVDRDSQLWFGFRQWLYIYDPLKKNLVEFSDTQGKWDSLNGQISYILQSKLSREIWVGTLDRGLYQIDETGNRATHIHDGPTSPITIASNQINAIHEDPEGNLWLATAKGLHYLNFEKENYKIFTNYDGLPNDFINGILPEGDSCLWVSTDNGLSRFNINSYLFTNFQAEDGISANEFNRMSFFKSSTGRFYFGGLNGVNAFDPRQQFDKQQAQADQNQLLITAFSKLDGNLDSLFQTTIGLNSDSSYVLSHNDKFFAFTFALANYRNPSNNLFSYQLEGFDNGWSAPSTLNSVRYNNIPPGNYRLLVRAKTTRGDWKGQLAIPIKIQEAYYKSLWFLLLCGLILLGAIYAFYQYRIYRILQRERALEQLVKERTADLEREKHKSEELLLNILPAETAEELKKHGSAKAKRHEMVTVMFTDFKGFTRISEEMDPEELVAEIDLCFRAFDEIIDLHGLEKIKTIGDAYLCVGGMAGSGQAGAVQVVKAALEIQEFMAAIAVEKRLQGTTYFEARIGIHSGPVVAGIVGIKKFAYDIWGDAVNIASRMETYGEVGRVNVSAITHELIKDHFDCTAQEAYKANDTRSIGMYYVDRLRAPHLSAQGE